MLGEVVSESNTSRNGEAIDVGVVDVVDAVDVSSTSIDVDGFLTRCSHFSGALLFSVA